MSQAEEPASVDGVDVCDGAGIYDEVGDCDEVDNDG